MKRSGIKRELKKLAIGFELMDKPEVVSIIESAVNYNTAQRELLKVYDRVYMGR